MFRRFVAVFLILCISMLTIGCGKSTTINGVYRKPVGLISMNVNKNIVKSTYSKKVAYDVCWGNVFWGVILVETIIAPIYFFGFSMFNPVGVADTTEN